jgi:hypothetical protein
MMRENQHAPPAGEAKTTSPLEARSRLLPVAIALSFVSILWIFLLLFGIATFCRALADATDAGTQNSYFSFIAYMAIDALYSLLLATGALSMIRRGSYAWAVVTSCLALVPLLGPFYVLGIPIGIWALVVLRSPAVRTSFRKP